MKPYIRIQSSRTITVTAGLQNNDLTNADAHIPDRLKVSACWPKATVQILEGAHVYPSVIAQWNTVKALANDGILTIGEELDSADDKVKEMADELALNMKRIEEETQQSGTRRKRSRSLEELSEE